MSTMYSRIGRAIKERRLINAMGHHALPYLWGALSMPIRSCFSLHVPKEAEPSRTDLLIAERVSKSYLLQKADQKCADPVFAPSEAWQAILDSGFRSLMNPDTTPHFLANFGIWPLPLGFDGNETMRAAAHSLLLRSYLLHSVFEKGAAFWRWFYGDRRLSTALDSPRFGNQPGAIDSAGVFLDVNCFHNEIRGSMLANVLHGLRRPVVADLGGGSGKTAEFMLRQLKGDTACYVDFDLPETLAIASYFLLSCYPKCKTLLYGEGTLNKGALMTYDIILWPSFTLPTLELERSIDLFINRVSLGEMASATAFTYVREIARLTRSFFFHMNHDGARSPYVYEGGKSRGPLSHEYPIDSSFRLLFRYPDLGHLLRQGRFDLSADVFMHLYERASD